MRRKMKTPAVHNTIRQQRYRRIQWRSDPSRDLLATFRRFSPFQYLIKLFETCQYQLVSMLTITPLEVECDSSQLISSTVLYSNLLRQMALVMTELDVNISVETYILGKYAKYQLLQECEIHLLGSQLFH